MKKTELCAIDLSSNLESCYEELQPYLESELIGLREDLISLPEDASKPNILLYIKNCVEALNRLSEELEEYGEGGLDTSEREVLCNCIYQMGTIVGLQSETAYIDKWREW